MFLARNNVRNLLKNLLQLHQAWQATITKVKLHKVVQILEPLVLST